MAKHLDVDELTKVVDDAITRGEYSIAKIAAALNMSERTFCRRMKELTDVTPKIFISKYKWRGVPGYCLPILTNHWPKSLRCVVSAKPAAFRMPFIELLDSIRQPIGKTTENGLTKADKFVISSL